MSATVSTGKLVGAFRGPNGQLCYVMFERTYEKNCYPHTPRWSALMIGDLASTMKAIFRSAAACEGGSLQGAGGRSITPENYIRGWLRELESPVQMADREIELQIKDTFQAPITQGDFVRVKDALLKLGNQDMVESLEAGESVTVSLHRDCEILSEIYDGRHTGAWRVIPSYDAPVNGLRNLDLGYIPKKAKASQVPVPRFMKVHEKDDNVLIQGSDGSWTCAGWAYSILSEYVVGLWQDELSEPGCYRSRLKALRNAVQTATCIDRKSVTVVVDTLVPLEHHQRRNVEGSSKKVAHTRVGSELRFNMPEALDELYYVTRLPAECTTWVIGDSKPVMRAAVVSTPPAQLSLLG
ncbi:hypothetical protein H8F21_14160 [Pseudomonas sp. P66]|uniref:Uncharacterized protein n=1 Tax=Pseudomonas arcuscaelestis TaxID=2710591 RepID=A0ABS2C063_9PSED|nr:hypothetical protein [Pseudomonas arcuscaelestis]MBM5458708.1 hypothetical protein [Pseudomonas arcuscaelestis]